MFLQGMTYNGIAQQLTEDEVLTPGGRTKWSISTVKSILRNEKYKGDALLQKTYTVDFLTKKTKVNEGEIPQYYVEGNHEKDSDLDCRAALEKRGILCLYDEAVVLKNGLAVAGRRDAHEVPVPEILSAAREKGVLALTAKEKIRLLPALNIPMEFLKEAAEILKDCCKL